MFIPSPKELSKSPERLTSGHRLCPGCGISVIMRQILSATEDPVIVVSATGCFEICTGAFPYTAWNTPWIHSLFENAASVASGIEAMQKALVRKGKLPAKKQAKILACGGDGATYDIGFQWLSGALERGHNFVYVCFDNEGYMNTGYQRSSSTPRYAATSTSPIGKNSVGKPQSRKDLTAIIAAHQIPYVAQGVPSNFPDLVKKARKAFEVDGPAFLNVLSVCPTNWKTPVSLGMEIIKKAVETCFWPLYEIENGKTKITYHPAKKIPIEEWLKNQKRFKHLLKPENVELVKNIQQEVDQRWENLQRCN